MTSQNLEFPSPYTSVSAESERPRMLPEVNKSCALAISAAYQLINDLRAPYGTIGTVAMQVCSRCTSPAGPPHT